MKQGNVKWFDCKKGYGFITPDGEVKDVFVHITQLEKIGIRKLFDGQRVSFDIYDDRGRSAAGNLNCCDFQSYNLMLTRKPAA